MLINTDGTQVKSSQIFKDDKFISCRLKLVNENSSSSASEYYHAGGRVTVPFIWESEPGTPKHRLVQTPVSSLPPLTPPPSYFFSSTTTTPVKRHSTRLQFNNNSMFHKFSFTMSCSATRHSSSSENSIKALSSSSSSSPSSMSSSTSPSVTSFQMTPLCDYYYSRRYGFAFEPEKQECIRSSSLSPFVCFRSKKCDRRNNARRSEERCSSVVRRRFLPHVCFRLIREAVWQKPMQGHLTENPTKKEGS